MRIISTTLRLVVLLSLLAVSTAANAFSFTVPYSLNNQEIDQFLSQKVKVEQSFGFPGILTLNYKLSDLHVNVGEKPNIVQMGANLAGIMNVAGEDFQMQIHLVFDATPFYDAQTGSIYLKNFNIVQSDIAPKRYMDKLSSVMPFLNKNLAKVLENVPIYTLNDNNTTQHWIKKFAKGIVVEKGKLSFDVGF